MRRVNKISIMALVLVLAFSTALVACSGNPTTITNTVTTTIGGSGTVTSTVTTTAPAKTTTVTTTAAASTTAPKVYNLKAQTLVVPGTRFFDVQLQQEWVDRMNTASGGKLNIVHTGSGSIVPDTEMHTAVGKGTIDMCVTLSMYFSGTYPAGKFLYGYPGQYTTVTDCMTARRLGLLDIMQDVYKPLGVKLLDMSIDYPLALMSTKPLSRLSDIKGKKIRAGGAVGEILGKAGASVVMMSGSELYTAMQTGVLDGVVYGTVGDARTLGLFDVAKYCVKDVHGVHFACDYFINQKVWDSLPKDLQEVILLATQINANESTVYNSWQCQGFYKEFADKGNTLITWPTEDFTTLANLSLESMKELGAKDANSAKILKIMQDIMATR